VNTALFAALALLSLSAIGQTAPPATSPATPQATPQPATPVPLVPVPINRLIVVIDPAHGGIDSGSRIGDSTSEKDVTLALAFRLRSLLSARGFTVVMTRDADNPTEPNAAGSPLTLDDRAGIANHARAVACLLLHATGSGKGLHLYTSELDPAAGISPLEPWLTAQGPWVPASRDLGKRLAAATARAGIATLSSSASIRPVDSLACPALVVELAPETDDADSITDAGYQQRLAQALAGALVFWQQQVQPPVRLPAPETSHAEPQP
jgi:N-acetylmuramoyl-L-alanine amidase